MHGLTSVYRQALIYRLKDAAKKMSLSELSRKSKLSRDTLYQALSPEKGNPSLTTLIELAIALELQIDLKPLEE